MAKIFVLGNFNLLEVIKGANGLMKQYKKMYLNQTIF